MLRSFLCSVAAVLSLAALGLAQNEAKPLNKPAIEAYVRHLYGLEKRTTVQVADPKPSSAVGFQEVVVSFSLGSVRQDIPLLVSNGGAKILRTTSSADVAHVHFLLNHFPTIGFLVGLGLYVASLISRSGDLKRASLVIFLGIALLSIPTYVTGNAAQEALCMTPSDTPCPEPAISRAVIQAHEGAALVAMVFMELTGALAWLGLWQFRRTSRVPGWNAAAILLIAIVTFGLMTRASSIGGEIRHPEVQSGPMATMGPPLARTVGTFVTEVSWVWPTCETLHFVGLSLLFGIALVVDLRMLGMLRSVPFAALHRLLPWGILGFGLNLITGMLFFVGDPGQYTQNIAFQWKLALILLAGINVIYFTIFDAPWALKPGDDAPFTAKFAAGSAIVLVVGVMYFGRMLPFLGNAF